LLAPINRLVTAGSNDYHSRPSSANAKSRRVYSWGQNEVSDPIKVGAKRG